MASARELEVTCADDLSFGSVFSPIGIAVAVWAQEGHPLTGSWHGEWHPAAGQKIPILIYMKWNSKAIEGTINPGRNAVPLKVADLDASNWTVHFEADTKDQKHIVDRRQARQHRLLQPHHHRHVDRRGDERRFQTYPGLGRC